MSSFAHVQHDESILEKVLHPLTGIDHLLAIAFVAASITVLIFAYRGAKAATTSGTVTRIRSRSAVAISAVLVIASLVTLVLL